MWTENMNGPIAIDKNNTNMYLEAIHDVLKYIYLQGKKNRRVNKCVHTLLKITRNKSFK